MRTCSIKFFMLLYWNAIRLQSHICYQKNRSSYIDEAPFENDICHNHIFRSQLSLIVLNSQHCKYDEFELELTQTHHIWLWDSIHFTNGYKQKWWELWESSRENRKSVMEYVGWSQFRLSKTKRRFKQKIKANNRQKTIFQLFQKV